jgi:hypothetical protein
VMAMVNGKARDEGMATALPGRHDAGGL